MHRYDDPKFQMDMDTIKEKSERSFGSGGCARTGPP